MYVTYTPKIEGWVLPPVQKPEYKALGDKYPTILTQIGLERFHPTCVSMCYVLRAADGTFVIIDSDVGDTEDVIYDVLKKQAPDPDNIVISAWFFTHPHGDHMGGFVKFAEKYANDDTVTLKQVVLNVPELDLLPEHEAALAMKTVLGAKSFGDDVTFVRAHAGDILYYADLTFRVLYTQEEYTAVSDTPDSNCCSIVTQMETDSGVKVLFGADHAVRGNYNGLLFCEGAIYKWYGDFIKSDVVTCFHHGFGGGADDNVYKVIKPTVVFWPVTYFRLYKNEYGEPYGSPVTEYSINQYFYDPEQAKANGVRACYVSGDKIQIMDLSNNDLSVTEYEHCDIYLAK